MKIFNEDRNMPQGEMEMFLDKVKISTLKEMVVHCAPNLPHPPKLWARRDFRVYRRFEDPFSEEVFEYTVQIFAKTTSVPGCWKFK